MGELRKVIYKLWSDDTPTEHAGWFHSWFHDHSCKDGAATMAIVENVAGHIIMLAPTMIKFCEPYEEQENKVVPKTILPHEHPKCPCTTNIDMLDNISSKKDSTPVIAPPELSKEEPFVMGHTKDGPVNAKGKVIETGTGPIEMEPDDGEYKTSGSIVMDPWEACEKLEDDDDGAQETIPLPPELHPYSVLITSGFYWQQYEVCGTSAEARILAATMLNRYPKSQFAIAYTESFLQAMKEKCGNVKVGSEDCAIIERIELPDVVKEEIDDSDNETELYPYSVLTKDKYADCWAQYGMYGSVEEAREKANALHIELVNHDIIIGDTRLFERFSDDAHFLWDDDEQFERVIIEKIGRDENDKRVAPGVYVEEIKEGTERLQERMGIKNRLKYKIRSKVKNIHVSNTISPDPEIFPYSVLIKDKSEHRWAIYGACGIMKETRKMGLLALKEHNHCDIAIGDTASFLSLMDDNNLITGQEMGRVIIESAPSKAVLSRTDKERQKILEDMEKDRQEGKTGLQSDIPPG